MTATEYRHLQLWFRPDHRERSAREGRPVPLHNLPQGEWRTVHGKRHLDCRLRYGRGKDIKLEGGDRREAFLSVVRVAAIRRLRWRRCNLTRRV